MYRLIDTHAHLDEIEGLEAAIAGARAASVVAIIAVGSDHQSNEKVLALAQCYEGFVYPALGLHPWNLQGADVDRNIEFIEANIDRAVAVGEIGLDYDKRVRARTDKDEQKRVLRRLLSLAQSHHRPVSVHSRYAWRDALDLVVEAGIEKAVFHWFTGTSSVLRDIIAHGYFISATPAVEYHEEHRRAVKEVPLAELLLETDSPVTYRRGTELEYQSRPADVARVLKGVSLLRGLDENEIATAATANAVQLFGLKKDLITGSSR